MQTRPLGNTGFRVSPIGFGAFKIGRNQNIKYPEHYELPDEKPVEKLLNRLLDLGISYIDTAPAYGLSEERIGRHISHRRREYILSTKIGETFEGGKSSYDFSAKAIRKSIDRSLTRLQTDVIDLVCIHSNGDDTNILDNSDAVRTLSELKSQGCIRGIGMSGKTVEGTRRSLEWADVIMVEYHIQNRSFEAVIGEAFERGVGVVVKKGLAAGHLNAPAALQFLLRNRKISSAVVGSLNLAHIQDNLDVAEWTDMTSAA